MMSWVGDTSRELWSLYLPSPDWFLGAEVGSLCVLRIQRTSMCVLFYRIAFRNSEQLPR